MRLSVKVVGGSECECEANPDSSVEALKRDVETKLKLDKETEQKLLYRGKALQDGTSLSDYKLTDGSKLNLVLKRRENNTSSPSTSSTNPCETILSSRINSSKDSSSDQQSIVINARSVNAANEGLTAVSSRRKTTSNQTTSLSLKSSNYTAKPLEEELHRALRPHFRSNDDTKKVAVAFKQIFQQRLASLSLDDIERLTRVYNTTNTLRF